MTAEWSRYAAQLVQVPDFVLLSAESQQRIRRELGRASSISTIRDSGIRALVQMFARQIESPVKALPNELSWNLYP